MSRALHEPKVHNAKRETVSMLFALTRREKFALAAIALAVALVLLVRAW